MPQGETQSLDSYHEQEQLRSLLRDIIDDYKNSSRTHQSTNRSPGTGKTFWELYAVLYALANDVFLLPTAFQAETAIAVGGLHDTKIFCLPVKRGGKSASSPFQDAEVALLALAKNPNATQLLLEIDGEVKEEGAMICAELWATEEIILPKLCNSDDYRADKLVISTMDHRQLKSIDGTSFLFSPAVLSNFKVFRLHHFVRSGLDPILQRFIILIQLCCRLLTVVILDEFKRLFLQHAIVDPDWADALIITDLVVRMFPKHVARLRMEEKWLREKCLAFDATNTVWYKVVKASDESKKKKSKSARWDNASKMVRGFCNRSFKEPHKLLLYCGGTYLLTFNNGNKFTQSRLAVLVDCPTSPHNYTKYSPIKMWVAPPAIRHVPDGFATTLDKTILAAHGWVETNVGSAPLHTRCNDKLGILYRQKQYGLRHNIAATIHSTIGATLPMVAIQISKADKDFAIWEKGMVQVAATRTTRFEHTIWVGERQDILNMLVDIMTKEDPEVEYIDQLVDKLSLNMIDVEKRLYLPAIDWSLYRRYTGTYSLNKDVLPGDNSGYVYLLISLKNKSIVYIGQTVNLPRRILQHNQGFGTIQTKNIRLWPWAVLAYIAGFNGRRDTLRLCESRWNFWAKYRRLGERSLTWTYEAAMIAISEFDSEDLHLVRYATLEMADSGHLVL
jgi:predicted GIY-YIG superfamily endonuclease